MLSLLPFRISAPCASVHKVLRQEIERERLLDYFDLIFDAELAVVVFARIGIKVAHHEIILRFELCRLELGVLHEVRVLGIWALVSGDRERLDFLALVMELVLDRVGVQT